MNSFMLLSDPVRFRIVEILASGEHRSGELADAIRGNHGVSRAAVSRHLAILRDHRWVDIRAEENSRWYLLTGEVWGAIEADVSWLKYLWARRIGSYSRNDSDPRLNSTGAPWVVHTESSDLPRGCP